MQSRTSGLPSGSAIAGELDQRAAGGGLLGFWCRQGTTARNAPAAHLGTRAPCGYAVCISEMMSRPGEPERKWSGSKAAEK